MARPLSIGHRGASGHEYENSRAAFRRAKALGGEGVELDIHATRDGAIVVHHEPFLETMRSGVPVFAVLPESRYRELQPDMGVATCVLGRQPTSDIKLREILAGQPPPAVLLITTRCSPSDLRPGP